MAFIFSPFVSPLLPPPKNLSTPTPRHFSIPRLPTRASQSSPSPSALPTSPTSPSPVWKTSSSTGRDLCTALRAAIRTSFPIPPPTPPTLVLAFVSGVRDTSSVPRALSSELRRARVDDRETIVAGCSTFASTPAEGVGVEIVAAWLPGVTARAWAVGDDGVLDWRQGEWEGLVGCGAGRVEGGDDGEPGTGPVFVLFGADGFDMGDVVSGLDFAYPRSAKVGVSAAGGAGFDGAVFVGGQVVEEGVGGLVLESSPDSRVRWEVVTSQGARPVGQRLTVTGVSDGSQVVGVRADTGSGVGVVGAPMIILDMWKETGVLEAEEADAARLYMGVEIPAYAVASTPEAARAFADDGGEKGEEEAVPPPVAGVVVRRVLGVDEAKAASLSGPPVRLGSGVRFHVRDQASVEDEMRVLRGVVPEGAIGGLLFTDEVRVDVGGDERAAFGGTVGRVVGRAETGPLPAPGFQKYYPIREPGGAASTFEHVSSAVFLLCYENGDTPVPAPPV